MQPTVRTRRASTVVLPFLRRRRAETAPPRAPVPTGHALGHADTPAAAQVPLSDVVRAPAVLPAFHPLAGEVTYVATRRSWARSTSSAATPARMPALRSWSRTRISTSAGLSCGRPGDGSLLDCRDHTRSRSP